MILKISSWSVTEQFHIIFDAFIFWHNKPHILSVVAWDTKFCSCKKYAFLTGNLNLCSGRFIVDEGFLSVTSGQNFLKAMLWKSNNIVACLAMVITCRKTTHSFSTIQSETWNHMTIFNNSISKSYQCCQ